MTNGVSAREIALDVLMEVLEQGAPSHLVLRQALEKYQYLEKRERSLITRLVEGTIEYRLTIDAVLDACSSVKVSRQKPFIRTLLRMSVYQLLWMDRIPDRAVCSEAVKLALRRHFGGLKGFVNGVLRTVSRRRLEFQFEDWERKYSIPGWIPDMWEQSYPKPVVERMLQSFLEERPTAVRCSADPDTARRAFQSLREQGVRVEESPISPSCLLLSGYDYLEDLEAFRQGWISVQDPSSVLVGQLADPAPGSQVLDVCGAPGGKSLHVAELLKGTGMVTVRDITPAKLALVEEGIARLGLSQIRTQVWDARVWDESWEKKADLVLADLPCSGLGIIGKKPDIKYQASPERIRELARLQRQILSAVLRCVKPGGRLIYSTCTVSRAENEEQRDWILQQGDFEPEPLKGLPAVLETEKTAEEGYLQLLPGVHPCDGFFIASFRRKK